MKNSLTLIFLGIFTFLFNSCNSRNSTLDSSKTEDKSTSKPTVKRTFEGVSLGMSINELEKVIPYKNKYENFSKEDENKTFEKDENLLQDNYIWYTLHTPYLTSPQSNSIFCMTSIKCYKGKVYQIVYSVKKGYENEAQQELLNKYPFEKTPFSRNIFNNESYDYTDGETFVNIFNGHTITYTDENYNRLIEKEKAEEEQNRRNSVQNSSSIL